MSDVRWRQWADELAYRDWTFELTEGVGDEFLRARFSAPDTVTGEPATQFGRKWRLSRHMTKSEFVMTAFKAVLTAVEHEMREEFLYRGEAVFGPHLDVDALHDVAHRVDVREPIEVPGGRFQQGVVR